MNDTTRDELRERIAQETYYVRPNYTEDGDKVPWEGLTDAFRAWRCEEADRIIALVTEARDAAVASAKHPPRRGNGMKETIRDRIKSIANDPHIKERYDMYADMVLGDLREALLSEPDADVVERAAEAIYVTNQASAVPRDKRWWITPFEEIVVDAQERYRDMARAALQAAAKGAEGDE